VTSQVHLYHSIVKIYDSEGHSKLTILQAKQIVKTYGTKQTIQEVLRGIDLNIETGEFVSIMGPSGSGKTTLLNVLSSIDYLSQGSVILNGKQLEKLSNKELSEIRKKDIGFIFSKRVSKSLVFLESKAPVGSSAKMILGYVINARAADVR